MYRQAQAWGLFCAWALQTRAELRRAGQGPPLDPSYLRSICSGNRGLLWSCGEAARLKSAQSPASPFSQTGVRAPQLESFLGEKEEQ